MPTYTRTHGDTLSPAEAAQLLTRAAQGEHLTHAPVKGGQRYILAHLATLTAQQQATYRAQVCELAGVLCTLTAPGLSA